MLKSLNKSMAVRETAEAVKDKNRQSLQTLRQFLPAEL